MTNYTQKLRKVFTEPRISYGLFFVGVLVTAVISYSAIQFGRYASPPLSILADHYAVGDTVEADGIALKVESVRYDLKGVPGLTPTKGDKFLFPMIDITNNTKTNFELIPLLFFYIKDSKGNVYHPTAAPIMTDQLTGPILSGEKVREEIGFEVPIGINNPTLYFERGGQDHPVIAVDFATPTL